MHRSFACLHRLAPPLIILLSSPSFSHAAGYGINENSGSYMGTGFAGRASNPVDASIAANNPAGISFISHNTLSAGSALILKGGKFKGQYTRPPLHPALGQGETVYGKTKDFMKTTPVPFGHFSMPLNDQMTFGLSGYGPFGVELDYKSNWPGKYFGDKTSVKVINIQGTLSYKLRDDFSIAFGLIGSHVKGKLTQQSGVPGFLPLDATIKGDDNTFGWNIGAIWQINEKTILGAVYHSKLDFALDGDIKARGRLTIPDNPLANATVNDKVKAKLDIIMPERAALGISHTMDDRWTLMADATWTRWSRFEEFYIKAKRNMTVNLSGLPDLPPTLSVNPSSYIPMNWKNVWAFSIGTSYQVTDEWLLRAGYMRDNSPVDDRNRTVRSPDDNRNWFTCGASWQASGNLSIDLSYAYVVLSKGKISESKHNVPGSDNDINTAYGKITGKYDNQSHIIAAQLNYRF